MVNAKRIMVVDDNPKIRGLLNEALDREGFEVHEVGDAEAMTALLARLSFDAIALDIGLPGEDGLSVMRRLRTTSDVPVVMITGKGDLVDKVIGLEFGADDYICKPFHVREVVARIRAVLRRRDQAERHAARTSPASDRLAFEEWIMDLGRRELHRRSGGTTDLTFAEFELLKLFVTQPNRVLTRDKIMDHLKGRAWSPYDRCVDMQVRRLRLKIEEDPSAPALIKTVRSAGYLFAGRVEAVSAEPAAT